MFIVALRLLSVIGFTVDTARAKQNLPQIFHGETVNAVDRHPVLAS
jgi:hypothetical protein